MSNDLMSEDIATRLREVAENLSPSGSYWVCYELRKAANHIDSLELHIRWLESRVMVAEKFAKTWEKLSEQ